MRYLSIIKPSSSGGPESSLECAFPEKTVAVFGLLYDSKQFSQSGALILDKGLPDTILRPSL